MKLSHVLAAASLAIGSLLAPLMASAGVVTFGYSGVVDQDDLSRGLSTFTGKFSFESSTPDQIADPQTADYKMGFWPLGMNVDFDGGAITRSIGDNMDVLVTNDIGGMDTLGALARTADLLESLSLTLSDFNALVFNNDSLPGGNLSMADFSWGTFLWEGLDGSLQGHITGLSCLDGCAIQGGGGGGGGCQPGPAPCPTNLPEPATPALSLSAFAALWWARRRATRPAPQPAAVAGTRRAMSPLIFGALVIGAVTAANAQVAISQERALAGGITAGDSAGFPVTISQPGNYRLTSNLTVPSGAAAIVITAPGVTLDLNGFTIQGPATCTTNFCVPLPPAPGIDAQATNVTVRNGIIKQFAGNGISFVSAGSFEDLVVRDNTGVGISRSANSQAEHDRTLMRHVQAQSNGSHGVVSRDTELVDCAAVNNAGHGFLLADSSLFDSSASANRNYGLYATGNVLLRGSQLYLNLVKNYGNWVISAGGNLNDGSLF